MRTKGSGETVPPAHCALEREAGGIQRNASLFDVLRMTHKTKMKT